MMDEKFETVDEGGRKRLQKYWEQQWLIGFYSDTPMGQFAHDAAVDDRRYAVEQ